MDMKELSEADLVLPSNIQIEPTYSHQDVSIEVRFQSLHKHAHIVTILAQYKSEEVTKKKKTERCCASFDRIALGSKINAYVQTVTQNGSEGQKIHCGPVWIKPGVVTDVSTTPLSENSEKIEWKPVPGATSYFGKYRDKTFVSNDTEYVLEKLELESAFSVAIAATNDGGTGKYSKPVTFQTTLLPPSEIEVYNQPSHPGPGLGVKWKKSEGAIECRVTLYKIPAMVAVYSGTEHEKCYHEFSDLEFGCEYRVRIQFVAQDSRRNSKTGYSESIWTCPRKISNVKVLPDTETSRTIVWDKIEGENVSYEIKIKKAGNQSYTVPLETNSYFIGELELSSCYTVSVTAENAGGRGEESVEYTFKTEFLPPSNINVEPTYLHKDAELDVSFEPLTQCEHMVTVAVDGEDMRRIKKTKTPRAIFTNIQFGSNLEVCVHTISDEGAGGRRVFAAPLCLKPGRVTNVTTTAASKDSQNISWKPVFGATSYIVKYKSNGEETQLPVTGTDTVLEDLILDTKFSVSVAAQNKGGTGEFSTPSIFYSTLSAPSEIKLESSSISSRHSPGLRATWKKCEGAINYLVDLLEADTSKIIRRDVVHSKCYDEFDNLQPGSKYKVRIQCIAQDPKRNSTEAFSEIIWTLPGKVSGVKIVPESRTARTIEWDSIEGDDVSYELTLKKAGKAPEKISTKVNSHFLDNLETSSKYTISVTPINSCGRGQESTKLDFETSPGKVTGVKIVPETRTTRTVEWDKIEGENVSYEFTLKKAGCPPETFPANTNSYFIENLTLGSQYVVSVTSKNSCGRSQESDKVKFETASPPPRNLRVSTSRTDPSTAINVLFDEPEMPALKYCVRAIGLQGNAYKTDEYGMTSLTISKLQPGQSYRVAISSIHHTDKSLNSEELISSPIMTAPGKPRGLEYKILSTFGVEISCKVCHGATEYIFNINGKDFIKKSPLCRLEEFDYDHLKVQITSKNEAGSSEPSEVLQFRQTLNFLRKKFLQKSSSIIQQDNFIVPVLKELSHGKIIKADDFQLPETGTVLIIGSHFTGKTSCCAYFLQALQNSKLGILIDYDQIKNRKENRNFETLLQNYITDISTDEMDFLFEWMKNNSEQVVFCVDNLKFDCNIAERNVSYDDEVVMQVFQAVVRTNREVFSKSQFLFTTSQTALQQILDPVETWEILGFGEREIKNLKHKLSIDVDIPPHLQMFCTNPWYCECILRLLKYQQEDVDTNSCSAILVHLLDKTLERYSKTNRKEKLGQIVRDVKDVPIKSVPKDQEKGKKYIKEKFNDEYTLLTFSNTSCNGEKESNTTCKVLQECITEALHHVFFSSTKEFENFLQKKNMSFEWNSHVCIMVSGFLREETAKKVTEMIFGSENIKQDKVRQKFVSITNYIRDRMEEILELIYTVPEFASTLFLCCNELNSKDLLMLCNLDIKITNDRTEDEKENVAKFVQLLPGIFRDKLRITTTTGTKEKWPTLSRAISKNPFSKLILENTENHLASSKTTSNGSESQPESRCERPSRLLQVDELSLPSGSQSEFTTTYLCLSDCSVTDEEIHELTERLQSSPISQKFVIEFCDSDLKDSQLTLLQEKVKSVGNRILKLVVSYMNDVSGKLLETICAILSNCNSASLSLVYDELDDAFVANLQQCLKTEKVKQLKNLDISCNKNISPEGYEMIGSIMHEHSIASLKASECDITAIKLQQLFTGLKTHKVEELDIGYNRSLSKEPMENLANFIFCEAVKSLKMHWCSLTKQSLSALQSALHQLVEKEDDQLLEELDLSYNPTIEPNSVLGLLLEMCKVDKLSMAGCELTGDHLLKMTESEYKLDILDIKDNSTLAASTADIANLAKHCQLGELNIRNCMFSAQELRNFKEEMGDTQLRCLHIGDEDRDVGDAYVAEVCELLGNVKNVLNLHFNELSQDSQDLLQRYRADGPEIRLLKDSADGRHERKCTE